MILIPAILEGYRSLKDKTLKVTFETNEPTPEQFLGIGSSVQQFGYLAFKKEPFKEREKEALEALETSYDDGSKSPAQRLRGVLYKLWEVKNEGFTDFPSFYNHKMERMINHYKAKIDS